MNTNDKHFQLDLVELLKVIWQEKVIVILVTMTLTMATVYYAISQPNIYKAYVLLAPAGDEMPNGMAGQFGGLAAFAGVDLSAGRSERVQLALETLQSRWFLAEFVHRHDILVPLMALSAWDPMTGQLSYDASQYDVETNTWVREVHPTRSVVPTDWEAYRALNRLITFERRSGSGYIQLSLESLSPQLAQQWVTWLVEDLNRVIQQRELSEITNNIAYLTEQLHRTQLAEMQKIFYQLIEEQIKKRMLAEVQTEYVFKVIDPALVPEDKDRPKRALICILGALLSGLLGLLLGLLNHYRKRSKC